MTDSLGNATQKAYDAANRYVSTTDAQGHVTLFTYDAQGNQLSMTDALGHITRFAYDNNNRRVQTIHPDGTIDALAYDSLGRKIAKTDQAGKATQFTYDALGRLAAVKDAAGQTTSYAYDELGNRISQTDANGHTTRFSYDQLGRRSSRTLPMGMTETYAFDAAGNMTSLTDFNGHTTTYGYDNMNQLITKTADPFFSAGACAGGVCGATQISFTYTPTGQRASMTDASGVTAYTYDSRDQVIAKATPMGRINYAYDAGGNLLSVQSANPGGASMGYAYDSLNHLVSVTDPSGATAYSYDPVGNLQNLIYANGVSTSYTYDILNRLTNTRSTCSSGTGCGAPGTALASYSYTLGSAGNRLSVAELSGRTVTYAYDSLYRLTTEAVAGDTGAKNGSVSYTFDAVGNRTQRSSTLPGVVATGLLSYDANDRNITDPYYANGNLLQSGSGTNVYDFENRLVQSGGVSIVYDGDGNRVKETVAGITTSYLVDTQNLTGYAQVLEELQGGVVTRVYTYGLELINERQTIAGRATTSFYGLDGHGSVRYLTDSTGAVTDTYDYDAFGNVISQTGSTPNNYLFAGEQFDPALGIYYNRARWLDQRNGRFLSMDPLEGEIFDPPSLHRYLYVFANPVNLADHSGLQVGDLGSVMGAMAIQGALWGMAIGATLGAVSGAILGGWKGMLIGAMGGAATGALFGAIGGGLTAVAIVTQTVWPLIAYGTLMTGWGLYSAFNDLTNPDPRHKVVGAISLVVTIV